MIALSALIIGISIYEIKNMMKNKQNKEMILFICFAIVTFLFGWF